MTAIFGILRFDGAAVSARDLERMGNALAHRGPDARKSLVQGPVGLGHCLLRVNREDLFERQPIVDGALTLVADCRIDNRDALAAELQISAQQLRDMPDSALVLRAYKKWAGSCAGHLLGDFAFALWDGRARKLVLARDHMGQRPVLYHRGKDFFAFSSGLKALWALPDVPQRVATEMMATRLLGPGAVSSEPGSTPFEDIEGLPGATVMTVSADGEIEARRYWEPRADPVHENRDEPHYIAAYRRVLGEAVNCRVRRLLHPPGMLLSGGYDSSAIAGLAGPTLTASGRKLVAVASVMPEDYRGTIRHARRWIEMCVRDMPHLDVHYYTRRDLDLLTALERAFVESGLPAGPYGIVNDAMVGIAAQSGARLIMDGQGGDYTLNPRGGEVLAYLFKTGRLSRFASELRAHRRVTEESSVTALVASLLPSAAALWRRIKHSRVPPWQDRAVNRTWAEQLLVSGQLRAHQARPADPLARMAAAQRRVMDAALSAADGTSTHAVQLTRPFHDKRVVELALAIPVDLYVKNGRNRYLACAALKDIYPPEFQSRWRKNDDEIPDFQRIVKSAEPQLLAEIERIERSDELRRYIDFDKIRRLLAARGVDDHNSGWERETQRAMQAFTLARYLDWMSRSNQ